MLKLKEGFILREIGGEIMVIPSGDELDLNMMITLNETGRFLWERLEKLGELTVYDRTAAADIVSRIGDAEIVFTNKTPLTAETFAACPNIRLVSVLATG